MEDIWIPKIDDINFRIIKLISNTSLYGVIFKVSIYGKLATLKVDMRDKKDIVGNKEINNESSILELVSISEPKLTTQFYDFQMLNDYGIKVLYDKMNVIPNWRGMRSNNPDYETVVRDYNVYILLMEYLPLPWIQLNVITEELLENSDTSTANRKLKIIYESIRNNINKLHNLHFVHCDLHSGNIMININNIRENKIIDFGRSFADDSDDMWNKEFGNNPKSNIKCNDSVSKFINELCGPGGNIKCSSE